MVDEEARENGPDFRCSLCGQAIEPSEALAIVGTAVVHEACLERSDASDLARTESKLQRDSAFDYRGHRLEAQSYLNPASRRWVPTVLILRSAGVVSLPGPDAWEMLTAHDDEQDTLDAADAHALALGRRWVDEHS